MVSGCVATSRDRCGRLPPDRWRPPAVTGVNRQSDVYSREEQTCLCNDKKLLCIRPVKHPKSPEIELSQMLLM